jgi:hypothetical protein
LAANGVGTRPEQITDEVVRHANPTTLDRTLSQTAIRNLSIWYRTDLQLYRECQAIVSEQGNESRLTRLGLHQ